MPEISRFLGIVIAMFYNEHAPPHFHARYGEHEATIQIADGVVHGHLPQRARTHVVEWHSLHRHELVDNWERARKRQPLQKIEPLE